MSSLERITEISGFGKSKIENFNEAGYESLEDLRGISWEELGEIPGVKSSAKRRAILNLLEEEGLRDKPEKEEKYEKFRGLLEELFQFESADLDFGIYRIMNERRDRIEQFLDEELEEKVEEELQKIADSETSEAEEEFESAKNAIIEKYDEYTSNGEVDEDELPEIEEGVIGQYWEAKKQLKQAKRSEETEAAVYQDLYRFFKRYYKDGDFIPQRRASNQEKYAIPYNGEEVKLHWANKEQYFVKTGEHFKDYKFNKDSYEVEFKLHDAHVEKNNKKGDDKFFVLREENPVQQDERFLTVHFEYRPLTEEDYEKYDLSETSQTRTYRKEIRRKTEEIILSEVSTELGETLDQEVENSRSDSTVLQKHLKNYRTKNENDYFIHKDLGSFLEQELDFYLKNEVFSWKEMTDDSGEMPTHVRARLKAIENIAQEIINFVAEIEDYQKKLFEKKKFVYQTDYMITLDKIPEKFHEKILDNDRQLEQWREVYSTDDWKEDLAWNGEFDERFIDNHPHVMIDTSLFDSKFKHKLISSFENLEEELSGDLYNAENWQALNLLQEKMRNSIDCSYVDPPYNAESSEIMYKNNFKHSSWLSLMADRMSLAKNLLSDEGAQIISIDKNERERLDNLITEIYPDYEKTCVTVQHNPAGVQGKNFSYTHENAFFIFPNDGKEYIGYTDREEDLVSPLRDWGGTSDRDLAQNCFYPIIVENGEIVEFGEVCDDEFHPESSHVKKDGKTYIYPIGDDGRERKWVFSRNSVEENQDQLFLKEKDGKPRVMRRKTTRKYRTVWSKKKYYANIYGSGLLSDMFGELPFDFPKSVHTVEDSITAITSVEDGSTILDYFAGSGTTAHATINVNREDEEERNYIMIEMGDYFDTVLKPRVQKAVFSTEWEDGVPQNREGVSQMVRYQRLEDYEDTLNNLDAGDDQTGVEEFTSNTLEYFLNFEVDGESLLDLDELKDPFNYEMAIREGDEAKRKTIDLVETFNYLLGLEVESIQRHEKLDREYRLVKGSVEGDNVVVVWRPVSEDDEEEFYEEEREFLNSKVLGQEDRVYINHESSLEAKPIEKTFQDRMWE